MSQRQISVTTVPLFIQISGAKLLIITNDSADNIFFDLDSDASPSYPPIKQNETISLDLGANNINVEKLSLIGAGTSTARLWWF